MTKINYLKHAWKYVYHAIGFRASLLTRNVDKAFLHSARKNANLLYLRMNRGGSNK